ncbi:hypothetical protein B0H10DRAFT_2165242 [Mycena sp. CBHHK59/15]|nr:hypothetical protein B0H10DRAFT_2165242 [Mycena sp. CBHHK59/15]
MPKSPKIQGEESKTPCSICISSRAFFDHRLKIFEKLKAEYDEFVKERNGKSWETSPMDVAKEVSKSLSERIVIAKVNGELWDLERPLESSCALELLDFEHPEGRKKVFWHSSAHVLGEAAERHYALVCHRLSSFGKVSESAIKEKQKFERLVVKKETLLEMFGYNKYKKYLIETKVPDGTSTTVYRCGPMVDLCVGPHIPHTGKIKAVMITKNSSSYFLGDAANDSLQRIYGISFPDKKQLAEYKVFLAEAAKRDHRRIGKDQELFLLQRPEPGSCFFLPHGTRIYNTLLEFMRSEYFKRGYQEGELSDRNYASCPYIELNTSNLPEHVSQLKLWETSGHWQNYKDDMFALDPMNCPGHCIIFGSRDRSYRELPLRMAEFGIIHRNEASGALTGLTRVRRFAQDDTHVFCMPNQVEDEISALFDFMQHQLKQALDKQYPGKWEINPGDGAFYGPKIDISVRDSLRRSFQCATIQLDFQLPERFDLKYRAGEDANNPEARPVMIHRAILGSLERFIAIITEHFAGKWPFWLSPRQVLVIPVAVPYKEYALQVCDRLKSIGLFADVDNGADTLQKKVRNGEIAQYNFILVVGEEETKTQSVNLRNRDDVGSKLLELKNGRSLINKL